MFTVTGSANYKISSVKENGPITYSPPTDSLSVKGKPGTTFHVSQVGEAHTIQALKEGTYAHINVEPPGYPLVNADGEEPFLWQIEHVPSVDSYKVRVYEGPYKDRVWLANRLGSPTPLIMVAPEVGLDGLDLSEQFTLTLVP